MKFKEKRYLSIIDLGSRSIKFLKGPIPHRDYNPKDFIGKGELVNPRNVDNLLGKYLDLGKDSEIIIIATEWYRRNPWKVKDLERKFGIKIKVLTPEEEARGTLNAWRYTGKDLFPKGYDLLMIDQGGASTEISIPSLGKWWSLKNGENQEEIIKTIQNHPELNLFPVATGSNFNGRHGEIKKIEFLGFPKVMINRKGLRYGIYWENSKENNMIRFKQKTYGRWGDLLYRVASKALEGDGEEKTLYELVDTLYRENYGKKPSPKYEVSEFFDRLDIQPVGGFLSEGVKIKNWRKKVGREYQGLLEKVDETRGRTFKVSSNDYD